MSYTQNSMASLRRDPGYWNAEHIAVERFEAYPKPDETTALAAPRSGRLNVAQIPFSQVEAAREAGFTVQLIPSMVVRVLAVNTAMKPFDDPADLRALKYAVDRHALLAASIRQAMPVDLSIAGLALLMAVVPGGAAGFAAALRAGDRHDRAVTGLRALLGTLPGFVVAIALVTVLSLKLGWLPSGGYVPLDMDPAQWLRYTVMPALALSLEAAAAIARQLRTSLVGTLRENYVTGAVMRGLPARRVVFGHALRNAAGPALTALGMSVPMLLGGAVVTQQIFALPGLAQLTLQSAEQHDIPVIQGTLLVTIAVVLVVNVAVPRGAARGESRRPAPGGDAPMSTLRRAMGTSLRQGGAAGAAGHRAAGGVRRPAGAA
ncbi:hypothetical protein SANTM175S_10431 [Streptomyces antimycoticus]